MKDIFKLQFITIRLVLLTSFCIQKMDKNMEMAILYSSSSCIYSTLWPCIPICLSPTWSQHTHIHIPSTLASWTKASKHTLTPVLSNHAAYWCLRSKLSEIPFSATLTWSASPPSTDFSALELPQ